MQDMNRLRKQGVSFDLPVKQFMSTPPLVVTVKSKIVEAASIMVEKKIHRLCVVDDEGKLLGWVMGLTSRGKLLHCVRDC
jgi:CBS domain-containing protein